MIRNGYGKPIVSLDIDGTLADYHGYFLAFAELYFGRPMPSPTELNPSLKLWRFMGVKKTEYDDCKLAYRQGGMKRSMPCLEGAGDLTRRLHRDGCDVWICTTRPYMRLDNIDPDTQEWLRRNRIEYDALLCDPRGGDLKYAELARQTKGRHILGLAEDLPEQAELAMKRLPDPPVWLRNQPYNRLYWSPPKQVGGLVMQTRGRESAEPYRVHRWDSADELMALAEHALNNWKATGK
jgi:hypothetical protein